MKKYFNILFVLAAVFALSACSKERGFEDLSEETGRLNMRSLMVSFQNEEVVVRSGEAPAVEDFTVEILRQGEETPVVSYKYGEMPEIVTLAVGTYTARARYGTNEAAAWNAPYYYGETENSFRILADQVTSDIDPIVCRLSNVKVAVIFDPALTEAMSADSKVVVNMGYTGSLEFTKADEERFGYFAYVQDSNSLAATFEGVVEGYTVSETKTYNNVRPGNYYKIRFSLHSAGAEEPGDISGDLKVDANVTVGDVNSSVDPGEEEILEDDMRPTEGNDPDDPNRPDDPTPPSEGGPTVESGSIKLDGTPNIYTDGMICRLDFHSETGFTKFRVKIDSPSLTPDELAGFGLGSDMDLINPEDMEEGLTGLRFPTKMGGEKDAAFDITTFLPMLAGIGGGQTHTFILTVGDSTGENEFRLVIKIP